MSARVRAAVALAAAVLVVAAPTARAGRPVTLASEDGTPLAGQLYEAASRPAPGVVLIHMLGRSRADFDGLAGDLQRAGLTALALDLRGHGSSGGAATPSAAMVADVRAAIDWLAARPGVRPDALALVGASLGANLALLAGAEHPAVRGMALLSPSLDYRGIRLDPALMKKAGARAILLVASTEDPYALRTIRDLTAASPIARQQWLSGAEAHGTRLLAADPALGPELVDWARRTLIF
ncbi:MAG: alpha/beta fold hydrolase [Acidobacteriota bacterium]